MGFCGGCFKALLIFFNIIFWLSGAAILGVGVWMIVDKNINSYFEVLNVDTHDQYFKYAAYMLIAFGVFVFLVGFFGCCGAIRGSKCLLGLYIFCLVLVFAGEIAAGVISIIYKSEVEKKVDDTLTKSIKEKYNISTTITEAWNVVQIQLDCCGGLGANDYNGSKFEEKNRPMKIPPTCCVLTNKNEAEEKPDSAKAKNLTACMELKDTMFFHQKGCKEGLIDWAKMHTAILIGVAMGIGAIQIFGLVIAICLCRQVDREEKY
ncbi:tetraspanin-1-like [Mya arenaria]|uniref:tetraspanin-1-like n=1 Tax=Mya arenaria TaxID=6604 RepID=UPI0022E6CFF8|nr:tetraspanin-1-like [Mya arenaria]XP_052800133.1 tetraspanin-1-like [Mya arenaria]